MSRPIAKDHDAKRVHILRVAARLFADKGYARASMSQVAKECGISKANIYHYYSSKDTLLFDILDTYLSALSARITGLALDGLEPPDQLGRVIVETLQSYEGMDHEHKIQTEGIPLLPEEQQKILKSYQRDMVVHMSNIVRSIAPDVFTDDPRKLRATVMSIFGMLNWFYMWNSSTGHEARDDYAKLVTKLTLTGVHGL
ncbi:TetR/AcrR family transcriptional regulator [Litorivita sp. NS0012-18]|uniref:TetR/AcrR family transcriptional regulator n=1 Tax=Litorivita sp. NS0012-18 TaxID=3127655 RepID=UPI0031076D37